MDKINITVPAMSERHDRYFARSVGTKFEAKVDDGVTQIDLYDEIGIWGIDHTGFRAMLKGAGDGDVVLRINSPGGGVMDGIGIYNDLLAHRGKVKVEIVGVAASIASIIALAGDEVVMAPNSFFMVHNSWSIGIGNRHDFEDMVSTLSKIDDSLARTYQARTKLGIRDIKSMMDDETWLTAKEALDMGFATSIADGADSEQKAKFDLSVFSSVPKALLWDDDGEAEDATPTKRDVERALTRDAGWSRSKARAATRSPEPSTPEVTQDADDVDLTKIAEALKAAREAIHQLN